MSTVENEKNQKYPYKYARSTTYTGPKSYYSNTTSSTNVGSADRPNKTVSFDHSSDASRSGQLVGQLERRVSELEKNLTLAYAKINEIIDELAERKKIDLEEYLDTINADLHGDEEGDDWYDGLHFDDLPERPESPTF